jgi:hypothetical protein
MQAPFPRPADQLGIVVPDRGAEIKNWLEEGAGPFFTIGGAMLSHHEYLCKKSSPRVNAAFGQVGPLQLELIHPIDDEHSIYRDFIEAGGNGLHHFGWFSDHLENDRVAAAAGGSKELQRGSVPGSDFSHYELAEPIDSPSRLVELGGTTDAGADASAWRLPSTARSPSFWRRTRGRAQRWRTSIGRPRAGAARPSRSGTCPRR